MDILSFSFNAVMPIFLMIALGMLLRKCGLLTESSANHANKLCFQVFIPFHLFNQIHSVDIRTAFDPAALAFNVISILAIFGLLCIIVPHMVRARAYRGEFMQGVLRGNISLVGLSLLSNLYGELGVQAMSVILPVTVILYNLLSTITLSYYSQTTTFSPRGILKSVATNPYLIACIAGLLWAVLPFRLPTAIASAVQSVGNIGTPLALLGMGAVIDLRHHKETHKLAILGAALRQFILPVLVLGVAVLVGFRDAQLAVFLCIACTPCAAGSYVLAKNMGAEGTLTSQMLLLTTLFSFFSMSGAIIALRSLGYM